MVKIGHASQSEHGTASGKAGDQTGREICISSWWDDDWTVLLRHPNPSIRERMAVRCENACENEHIGYSQSNRNSLRAALKRADNKFKKIVTSCNTDCSAFMSVIAESVGIQIKYTRLSDGSENAPTTSNMRQRFTEAGFIAYTDKSYLRGTEKLLRGDILVAEGKHTVMALEDGKSEGYYPKYTGNKILTIALREVGEQDTSYTHRAQIAKANGIIGYSGSEEQNLKLLALLKSGKLKKA